MMTNVTKPTMLEYQEWLAQETELAVVCGMASRGMLVQTHVPATVIWRVCMYPTSPQLLHELTWCHVVDSAFTMARSFRLPFTSDFALFQQTARIKLELLKDAVRDIMNERHATQMYGLEVYASYIEYRIAEPAPTLGVNIMFSLA
jgi:hypothetical protein